MTYVIAQIIKYVIALFMSFYAFSCFSIYRKPNETLRAMIYFRQNLYMILIYTLSFIVLILETKEKKYVMFYAASMFVIVFFILCYSIIYRHANRLIINNMCMLLMTGYIILARLSFDKAVKQFVISSAALFITMMIPFIISRGPFFSRFSHLYSLIGIGSLLLVLIFSKTVYGAKLNVTLFGYTFQPSEFVKIIFVFAIAGYLSKAATFKQILISAIVAVLHILILVLSKDLGSAVILFVVYISMLYVATEKISLFLLGIVSGAFGAVLGYRLFNHVRVRVTAFLDPFSTIDNAGYQIAQSLFAIGTGSFFGLGIMQGAPDKIPVVSADFIYSAISEEFGSFFGICVILICVSCFVMFMNIAIRFNNLFYKYVAVGLSILYSFQVFLTIGGVTKFIPLTGVTLPLVSYGGTSVLVTLLMFSIIQGLYLSVRKH